MLSGREGPYADAMILRQSDEHAALVALLQARPDGHSWPEIAAELLEVGSAVEVWERHAPTALIDLAGDATLESAAEDVRSWTSQGYRLLSILDRDYPVWLRGVQQAPPMIFTLGTVISDDAAVSVVGSRDASPAGLALAADIARALVARKLTVIEVWPEALRRSPTGLPSTQVAARSL